MDLGRLEKLIGSDRQTVKGCSLSADEAAMVAHGKFAHHSFCLVKDWTILDLEITDEERNILLSRGLKPVLLYALHVVHDSRGRFAAGDWVRSSFQQSYDDDGFFITKNTVYVLLGDGNRQQITARDLLSLQ